MTAEGSADPGRFDSHVAFHEANHAEAVQDRRIAGRGMGGLYRTGLRRADWSDGATPDLALSAAPRRTGAAAIDLGHGRFRVPSTPVGNFALIPPGTPTTLLVDGDHALQLLSLPYGAVLYFVGPETGLPEEGDFGHLHAKLLLDRAVSAAPDGLWMARGPAGGSALLADGLILVILDRLPALRDRRGGAAAGGLAAWLVRRVMDYLQGNLSSEVSLGELAALVRLSPHHFCRAFRASTGLPPHRTHPRIRLERAQQSLLGSDLGIGGLAAAVGYDEPSHLAPSFRRETPLNPQQYRWQGRA